MGTINLNKLNIGFGSTYEQTDYNTFTIQGDITIQASQAAHSFNIDVDKLTVVYNNDGLLDYMLNSTCPQIDLFYDTEHGFVPQEIEFSDYPYKEFKFVTDSNSINIYADFEICDDDVF